MAPEEQHLRLTPGARHVLIHNTQKCNYMNIHRTKKTPEGYFTSFKDKVFLLLILQVTLGLAIFLPRTAPYWNYRHVLPCLAPLQKFIFLKKIHHWFVIWIHFKLFNARVKILHMNEVTDQKKKKMLLFVCSFVL